MGEVRTGRWIERGGIMGGSGEVGQQVVGSGAGVEQLQMRDVGGVGQHQALPWRMPMGLHWGDSILQPGQHDTRPVNGHRVQRVEATTPEPSHHHFLILHPLVGVS